MKERITECDFCGEIKKVVITHYGTTHYNRLICKECIDRINKWHKDVHGEEKTLNDDGTWYEE